MEFVFVLQHCYESDDIEEVKFIGVYSSNESAMAAIERLKGVLGFKDHPVECFCVDRYRIDEDNWKEGFDSDWS